MKELDSKNQPRHQNDFYYQNGESDAERLMRDHLNTPGHVISDEELKNLKVGVPQGAQEKNTRESEEDKNEGTPQKTDEPRTPWDIMDA